MRTRLTKVIRKAFRDEAFLNALVKNPARALKARKMELSTLDREKLKSALRSNISMKGSELLKMLVSAYAKSSPPPPPWPIRTLRKVEPEGGLRK
jgi:hypothetical protein